MNHWIIITDLQIPRWLIIPSNRPTSHMTMPKHCFALRAA
uniref:Uncharacterized protein n=1 Tax=Arundo donax TaxID=35708 RepID=A0A0A9B420_ARUDO